MPKQRRGRRFPLHLRESAATAERVALAESIDGAARPQGSGLMLLQLVTEGWGSSGFYAGPVLAEAARVFPAGTRLFMDHATAEEEESRPERSVKDLAAVLVEDARYDPDRRGLVALAKPLPTYRHLLADKDFVEAVGLSIRASGIAEHGTAEGRSGLIVREITSATSVDFVTRAGRGGKVLALLESARTQLAEAPTEQTRTAIDRAVRAAWAVGEDGYAWVRDYDPDRSLVWFEAGARGIEATTWEQHYTGTGRDIALVGDRRPVVAETVYRPAPAGMSESADPAADEAGQPPASTTIHEIREGPAMSGDQTGGSAPASAGTNTATTVQISEAEHRSVVAARDAALREAADAKRELAGYRAVEQARPIVASVLAESGLPHAAQAKVQADVLKRVPLTEAGVLDDNALRGLVLAEATGEKAYLAQLAEANGVGQVAGMGAAVAAQPAGFGLPPAPTPNAALVEAFERRGLPRVAAEAAALGRAL